MSSTGINRGGVRPMRGNGRGIMRGQIKTGSGLNFANAGKKVIRTEGNDMGHQTSYGDQTEIQYGGDFGTESSSHTVEPAIKFRIGGETVDNSSPTVTSGSPQLKGKFARFNSKLSHKSSSEDQGSVVSSVNRTNAQATHKTGNTVSRMNRSISPNSAVSYNQSGTEVVNSDRYNGLGQHPSSNNYAYSSNTSSPSKQYQTSSDISSPSRSNPGTYVTPMAANNDNNMAQMQNMMMMNMNNGQVGNPQMMMMGQDMSAGGMNNYYNNFNPMMYNQMVMMMNMMQQQQQQGLMYGNGAMGVNGGNFGNMQGMNYGDGQVFGAGGYGNQVSEPSVSSSISSATGLQQKNKVQPYSGAGVSTSAGPGGNFGSQYGTPQGGKPKRGNMTVSGFGNMVMNQKENFMDSGSATGYGKSTAYKPYTLKDYREKKTDKYQKLGGLGANVGTDEWQERREKLDKMKRFASEVKIQNTVKHRDDLRKRAISSEPSKKKTESNSKRAKALSYAKNVPIPKTKKASLETTSASSVRNDEEEDDGYGTYSTDYYKEQYGFNQVELLEMNRESYKDQIEKIRSDVKRL